MATTAIGVPPGFEKFQGKLCFKGKIFQYSEKFQGNSVFQGKR